jgi:hypothetical protein
LLFGLNPKSSSSSSNKFFLETTGFFSTFFYWTAGLKSPSSSSNSPFFTVGFFVGLDIEGRVIGPVLAGIFGTNPPSGVFFLLS